jgi:hypothetical protein
MFSRSIAFLFRPQTISMFDLSVISAGLIEFFPRFNKSSYTIVQILSAKIRVPKKN